MGRRGFLEFALAAAAAAVLVPHGGAQAGQSSTALPYPVKQVPSASAIPYPVRPVPTIEAPFPLSGSSSPSADAHPIVYRHREQMSEADRALAAKARLAIRNAAVFAGIEFDNVNWSYRQLECQAAPSHLFLLFEGNGSAGSASWFSASIPRSGKGHVRVIPVERRGFTLFLPAPVSALAIGTFNRIRAEEPKDKSSDWLATSLCYAALTEPQLEIALSPHQAPNSNLALSFPPSLDVGQDGEFTVRFVNVSTPSRPMQWILTFDARDRLIKVVHIPTPVYATRIVPKN